jgi:hypothetical protein
MRPSVAGRLSCLGLVDLICARCELCDVARDPQEKERMHAVLNSWKQCRRLYTPGSRGMTPVSGLPRPMRFCTSSPGFGSVNLGSQQTTRDMSTCTTLDDPEVDVQRVMQDAVGYTRVSPYQVLRLAADGSPAPRAPSELFRGLFLQLSHEDMVTKPLGAADAAACAAMQYNDKEWLAQMQRDPSAKGSTMLQNAVSIEHIGLQVREGFGFGLPVSTLQPRGWRFDRSGVERPRQRRAFLHPTPPGSDRAAEGGDRTAETGARRPQASFPCGPPRV